MLAAAAAAAALVRFLPPTRRGVDLAGATDGSAARVRSSAGSAQLGAVRGKLLGAAARGTDDEAETGDGIVLVDVVLSGGAAKAAAALAESSASFTSSVAQRQSFSDTEKQVATVAATGDGALPSASSAPVACAVVAAYPPSRRHEAGNTHDEVGTAVATTAHDEPTAIGPHQPADGNAMQNPGEGEQSDESDVRVPRLRASRVIEKSRLR